MNQAQLAKALAAILATKSGGSTKKAKGRKPAAKAAAVPNEERKAAFAEAVVKAGEKAGFKNVVPNETMLTYAKWEEKGFVVKKGEKSIRVKTAGMNGKGIPLFHRDQVEAAGEQASA